MGFREFIHQVVLINKAKQALARITKSTDDILLQQLDDQQKLKGYKQNYKELEGLNNTFQNEREKFLKKNNLTFNKDQFSEISTKISKKTATVEEQEYYDKLFKVMEKFQNTKMAPILKEINNLKEQLARSISNLEDRLVLIEKRKQKNVEGSISGTSSPLTERQINEILNPSPGRGINQNNSSRSPMPTSNYMGDLNASTTLNKEPKRPKKPKKKGRSL
ncbi:hypothetical protein ACE939_06830 [Aquimarina sp. W85]|uniref:hypothetical protein n=1 Tax=Aquimarina rhodophyticola TaxID=3342246 RepID=UPI00367257B7